MKIIFLGTSGWYTNNTGNTACVLLDSHSHYVILDAGNGFYKLDKYILENKPISLFLSHLHLDHISGLHTLPKFSFTQGIDIFIVKGRAKEFHTLIHPPYTIGLSSEVQNIVNLRMDVRLHEVSAVMHNFPFPFSVIELHHAYGNHGYRIMLDNLTIAYSGDSGICQNSKKLASSADVLIHECSYLLPKPNDVWGHVDPVQAATLAKQTKVRTLLLTHFDPTQYPQLETRKEAENKARTIFPNTIAAYDNMVITL